jgi:hypothetical protein
MTVAYDSTAIFAERETRSAFVDRPDFRRLERIVVLGGGVALGLAIGFVAAIGMGHPSLVALVFSGAAFETLALYLCSRMLRESLARKARGCAAATIVFAAALLAWPLTGLFAPVNGLVFWTTPLVAVCGLALFASCWDGPPRAIYRLGLQGALVSALAAYQGASLIMAG